MTLPLWVDFLTDVPQIQVATGDLLHFFEDDRLPGGGGKVLQRGFVAGFAGYGILCVFCENLS